MKIRFCQCKPYFLSFAELLQNGTVIVARKCDLSLREREEAWKFLWNEADSAYVHKRRIHE